MLQPTYPHRFSCQLPAEQLLLCEMHHSEHLGALGSTEVTLLSADADIDPDALLGTPACVALKHADESERYLHGLIAEFEWCGTEGRHHRYRAVLRAWPWFLGHTSDCRIYQHMTVPEIVQSVFADHPIANYELRLFRSYAKREYCVQYRETDLAFVLRLLEEEGIYFFFQHEASRHKLIVVDDNHALDPCPGLARLPYYEHHNAHQDAQVPDHEHISHWQSGARVVPGRWAHTDYDFKDPVRSPTKLHTEQANPGAHDLGEQEVFDYPGGYTRPEPAGRQLAETRLQQLQLRRRVYGGHGNSQRLCVGHYTELVQHPRADQNTRYLLCAVRLHVQMPRREAGAGVQTEYHVNCGFEAIALKTPFRPERRTPKPFVQGPQTAVVVGPVGEEIHTDEHGQVKVQFHWDRLGAYNDHSSCWVRVSQPWAGHNFGAVHIPRIGQEVIVDFLEGDPDRPIITGRVYNAEQTPPWSLPANKTQSGVLTRSSKGGGADNANAIRLEDKKGAEQIWIHAERNQDIEVEVDETHWVGQDRSKTIDRDEVTHVKRHRTETVDAEETITIHGNRTEEVDRNETITIHQNRNERVDLSESVDIGTSRSMQVGTSETLVVGTSKSDTIGVSYSATIGTMRTGTVGAVSFDTVGFARMDTVGGGYAINVALALNTAVGMSWTAQVGHSRSTTIGTNDETTVGATATIKAKRIVLHADEEVLLSSGNSTLRITPSGIEILSATDKLNC